MRNSKVVRGIKWSGNFSDGDLCENSHRALKCHNSLRLCHLDYLVSAVRNLAFANCFLDEYIKRSTLFGMWKCASPAFDTAISQFVLFLSEIWLWQIDGNIFLTAFSVNSHDSFWKWKRYRPPQFLKLVIFSIYPSSIGINWHFHIPKEVDHFIFSSRMRFEKSHISDRRHWIVLMRKP